ncbi:MAG: hypothetical protein DMF28_08555 [Verrucomicrobia bacterium]|nr:MAG: hypothetical protein DMF28_08555 [Verrucomicrobiota bacterium]
MATHVHGGASIKSWRLAPDLRIARALAVKRRVPLAPDKQVAVRVHIERSVHRPIGNVNWTLPGDAAVGGALEFHATAAAVNAVVGLVLETMARAVSLINGEPFLVAAAGAFVGLQFRPGLTTVCRAPKIVAKKGESVRSKTEVEEITHLIGVRHWVTTKNIVLQNARKRPRYAAIGGITPAALPEVGVNVIELPPGDRHFVAVCRVNGDRALVRGVPEDVLSVGVDVCLVTSEQAELRNHARRRLNFSRRSRRVIVFFQRLIPGRLVCGRQLGRSAG